jgi:hypothetical protein
MFRGTLFCYNVTEITQIVFRGTLFCYNVTEIMFRGTLFCYNLSLFVTCNRYYVP